MKNPKLIYTPNGLPVGEPVVDEYGKYYLRIKNGDKYDDISIDDIFYQSMSKTNKKKQFFHILRRTHKAKIEQLCNELDQ